MRVISFFSGWVLLFFLVIGAEQHLIGAIADFFSKYGIAPGGILIVDLTMIYILLAVFLILRGYFGGYSFRSKK